MRLVQTGACRRAGKRLGRGRLAGRHERRLGDVGLPGAHVLTLDVGCAAVPD